MESRFISNELMGWLFLLPDLKTANDGRLPTIFLLIHKMPASQGLHQ